MRLNLAAGCSLLFGVAALSSAGLVPADAVPAAGTTPRIDQPKYASFFETDSRVDRPVRITQMGGDLARFLRQISTHTRIRLEPAETCAATPLSRFGGQQDLRQLLRALQANQAHTLLGSGEPPAYRLARTSKDGQARKDAALRLARRGKEELNYRWDLIRRMASLPDDKRQELDAVDPAMARVLRHPRGLPAARVGVSLPESVYEALWREGRAKIKIGQLSQAMQKDVLAMANIVEGNSEEDYLRYGNIRLVTGGTPDRPTVHMMVRGVNAATTVNLLYAEGWTREDPSARRRAARRHPTAEPGDPRFKKLVSVKDSAYRFKQGGESGTRPPNALPLAPLLRDLSVQASIPILAQTDYHPRDGEDENSEAVARWVRSQWWMAEAIESEPLTRALDLLCADFEMEWEFKHGTILIRPKRWCLPPQAQRPYHASFDF